MWQDLGAATECIAEALKIRETEDPSREARAYVGASLFAEAVHELRNIRKLLTPAK